MLHALSKNGHKDTKKNPLHIQLLMIIFFKKIKKILICCDFIVVFWFFFVALQWFMHK